MGATSHMSSIIACFCFAFALHAATRQLLCFAFSLSPFYCSNMPQLIRNNRLKIIDIIIISLLHWLYYQRYYSAEVQCQQGSSNLKIFHEDPSRMNDSSFLDRKVSSKVLVFSYLFYFLRVYFCIGTVKSKIWHTFFTLSMIIISGRLASITWSV